MNTLYKLTLILMLVTVPLSACAAIEAAPPNGQVVAVQIGTTLWGMRNAILEKPGTMMMMRDNLLTFFWALEDGWAFATINWTSKAPVQEFAEIAKNGTLVNCTDASCLVDVMKNNGWRLVAASEVPSAIRVALSGSSSWLISLANNMPTFLVVPASTLDGADSIIVDYLGVEGG